MSTAPTYQCPHCGTTVEVNPAALGDPLTCPSPGCGKPFRVEVPTASPAAPPVAQPTDDGTAPVVVTEDALVPTQSVETTVGSGERIPIGVFRRYPLRFAGYVLLLVAGLTVFAYNYAYAWYFLAFLGAVAAAIAGYRLTAWWLRTLGTALVLTEEHVVLETGFFSRQTTVVPRADISEVVVEQGVGGGMFNVGDIIVSTNGKGKRIVLLGVPNPEAVASRIRNRPPVAIVAEAPAPEVHEPAGAV
jgi:membrane protein YdbS with pleckstrin-like domain